METKRTVDVLDKHLTASRRTELQFATHITFVQYKCLDTPVLIWDAPLYVTFLLLDVTLLTFA